MPTEIVMQKSGHAINPTTGNKLNMSDTPLSNLDLNKLFGSEVGGEADVVKELFNPADIEVKTELSQRETKIVSRLELMSDITNNPMLRFILRKYETLQVSKDRQSRKEVVSAIVGMDESTKGGNVFTKFKDAFKTDK